MTHLISKQIDKIFSSELNHNRNLLFNKRKISNKSVKNKIKNNSNNNKDKINLKAILNQSILKIILTNFKQDKK